MNTIETLVVTPIQQNCRLFYNERDLVIFDPGGDAGLIQKRIAQLQKKPVALVLTHSHFDHCGGVAPLLRAFPGIPLYGHPGEKEFRGRVEEVAQMYGLGGGFENCPEPTQSLLGDEEISLLGTQFKVLFTPGHAPGHLSFYAATEGIVVSGDALFAGAIGRTDLPYGDQALLTRAIKEKLYTLPDSTRVLSGHGPETTIGREKKGNPFVRG